MRMLRPTALRNRIRDFIGSQRGTVAILFSVVAIPIVMGTGLAVDYGRKVHYTNLLRQATDAAALAGTQTAVATGSSSQATTRARQSFDSAIAGKNLKVLAFAASYDSSGPKMKVTATGNVDAQIFKFFGQPDLKFSVKSTAAYNADETGRIWPVCVLVDAYDQKHTLMTVNSARLNFTNCMVQVNTIDWDAVEARDSSVIASNDGENCFVGEIHMGDVTPPKNPACTYFADPFKGKAMPASAATCNYTNLTVSATKTLAPGTYCGNTTITGGVITMSPGLYIFKDGNLTLNGSANVNAYGVTFILTGAGPNFYMNGSSRLTLTPMTTGDFAGFAMYLDNNSVKTVCSAYDDGGQMLKSPSIDTGLVPSGKTLKQANTSGIANCINAIQDYATLTATGVIYLSQASFLAAEQSTVNLTGSFISGFLLGEGNARFNLVGSTPSSSLIAAQMQKRTEKTTNATKSVKLIE